MRNIVGTGDIDIGIHGKIITPPDTGRGLLRNTFPGVGSHEPKR